MDLGSLPFKTFYTAHALEMELSLKLKVVHSRNYTPCIRIHHTTNINFIYFFTEAETLTCMFNPETQKVGKCEICTAKLSNARMSIMAEGD